MSVKLDLSKLPKTWLIDIDGTILKHNGYLAGKDILLPGVKKFFSSIPSNDKIILLTSRKRKHKKQTEQFLNFHKIQFDHIIYDLPFGERILLNDNKPSGLKMAHVVCLTRDVGLNIKINILEKL